MNEIPRGSPYYGRYPQVCPHCGSEWFYGRDFAGVEVVAGLEGVQHRVIICLCGMPQQPVIGGVRGGKTPNRAIHSFDRDFERTQRIATVTKDKLARKRWESVTQRLAAVAKAIDDRRLPAPACGAKQVRKYLSQSALPLALGKTCWS